MVEPYIIKNVENQNLEIGTVQKPHFFHVTSGVRDSKSLLFHAQMPSTFKGKKRRSENRQFSTF